ncbi:MAG: MFS transporter [bacterium]|nr:MFS transporter [bacterium]
MSSSNQNPVVLLGTLLVLQAVGVGVPLASFGVFVTAISEDFETSRSVISLGLTLFMVSQAVAGPLIGGLADRVGVRAIALLGAALLSVGVLGLSMMPGLPGVAVFFVGPTALGAVALGPLIAAKAVSEAFTENRASALGISGVGPSLGGLLLPPVLAIGIEQLGWREICAATGWIIGLAILPLVWFGLRGVAGGPQEGEAATNPPGLTFLRQREFWVLLAVFGSSFAVLVATGATLPPLASDRGADGASAALLVSIFSVSGIAGNVFFGWLADRMDHRRVVWLAQLPLIAMCVALVRSESGTWLPLIAAVGGTAGGLTALWATLIGDVWPAAYFGRIMGVMGMLMLPLNIAGVQLAALSFDRQGGYGAAFAVFALAIVAAAVVLLAFRHDAEEASTLDSGRE